METDTLAILVLLNNFLHDFCAAGWVFGAVILWSVLPNKIPTGDTGTIAIKLLRTVLVLMHLSFIGIVLFGLLRALAYKTYEWNEAAGHGQVLLLIIKHVIFTLIFLAGLVYYIKASKLIRIAHNDETK